MELFVLGAQSCYMATVMWGQYNLLIWCSLVSKGLLFLYGIIGSLGRFL
jgi:hypothetical protein